MTNFDRNQLMAQFANATYQAERWAREAAIAKQLLDDCARDEAEAQFRQVPKHKTGKGRKTKGEGK